MKRLLVLALFVTFTTPVWAQSYRNRFNGDMFGGSTNQQVIVTIKADGTAQIRTEGILARPALEQQLRMMEFYRQAQTGEEDAPTPPKPPEPKPYTDEELAQAIRKAFEQTGEDSNTETTVKVAELQVAKDTVRLAYVQNLASLTNVVEHSQTIWGSVGMYLEDTRFETDADGRLKLTLKPHAQVMKDWQKGMQRALKLTGARSVLTLVFPGKVISSSLPVTEGNSTGLVLDGKQEATIAAVAKAFATPVTIIAEAAGLKLSQPVDYAAVREASRKKQDGPYEALPVADAGPGFVGEPVSVTMTTAQLFPGAEKQLQRTQFGYELNNTGLVVRAKLFLPKGRSLLGASQPHVVKAQDNKGRNLVRPVDPNDGTDMEGRMGFGDRGNTVDLRLQLPSPDAQSIEEIQVESIVTTVGKWKEHVLTNLQANAEMSLDLGALLPSAKLTITKLTNKKGRQSLEGKLTGPVAIRQLDVKFKMPNEEHGNSSAYDRNYSVKNAVATRTIQVELYTYDREDKGGGTPPSLVVRIPEDPRRERVRFALKGLDLY